MKEEAFRTVKNRSSFFFFRLFSAAVVQYCSVG